MGVDPLQCALVEAKVDIAELAGHDHLAADLHVGNLVAGQGAQDPLDAPARAAAAGRERTRLEDPDSLVVEQAVQQVVGRQCRVEQLPRRAARHEHHGAAPAILLIGRQGERHGLLLRQLLEQQSTGAPAALYPPGGELDRGLELLRLAEVVRQNLGQGLALKLDDALVALGVDALVDGEGHVALAHQGAGAGRSSAGRREARLVVFRIAAQLARRGHVRDQHADRPVALGLQGEDAVELQETGEHTGQRQKLAEQSGHRLRVVVAVQDRVDQRAHAHQAAAQGRDLEQEGLDLVGRRRRGADGALGHGSGHSPRHHSRMPFWACSRFSASSQTTDCGPSITSAVTSSPRCAGRQCRKIASCLARAMRRRST